MNEENINKHSIDKRPKNKIGPIICEWCKTPLENVKILHPNKDGQYPGYCPHCKAVMWSDPVKISSM